jgi:hypothetical protein
MLRKANPCPVLSPTLVPRPETRAVKTNTLEMIVCGRNTILVASPQATGGTGARRASKGGVERQKGTFPRDSKNSFDVVTWSRDRVITSRVIGMACKGRDSSYLLWELDLRIRGTRNSRLL